MNNRGVTATALVTAIVGIIVVFYVLAYCYQPLEDASMRLSHSLGADITNETLGTADANGNLTAYTDFSPVESGSETVYANGTPSTSWTNATYSITYSTGKVVVYSNGTNPSTANAVITIDYNKEPQISGIEGLSSLPGVAVLLFVLITVIGIILMATGRRGL